MSSLETRPAPPAGVATMSLVRWTLVIFMALVAFASVLYAVGGLDRLGGRAAATMRTQYHCPMHPSVVQDHPGECPICSMTLVPLTEGPPATATEEAGVQSPPGLVPIELSPERVQLTGVRTATVMRETAHGDVRAAGVVVESEHGQAQISARSAGWIQDLFVAETGRQVRKGQPLASIYSPDVLRAEQELVTARTWTGGDTARLALDARKRLELLGVAAPELDELERTGQVQHAVVLRSPGNGTIVRKSAVVGTYVQPGVELFALADLSTVWFVAEVFEQAVPQVRVGQAARVELAAFPGAPFEGRVQFIAPTVDATTRTCRVRVELRNPKGKLKPGMFGTVVLTTPPVEALIIPSEALVDTGGLQYVYVAKDNGRFEPRVVKVGAREDGRAQVLEGLAEGETVVTTANFFLDSESRMRAGIEGRR